MYHYSYVTSQVQECKFRVRSENMNGQLGESMGRLGEQGHDFGRVLSGRLGEQALRGENPNFGG